MDICVKTYSRTGSMQIYFGVTGTLFGKIYL